MTAYDELVKLSKQAIERRSIVKVLSRKGGLRFCMLGPRREIFTIEYAPYSFSVYLKGKLLATTSKVFSGGHEAGVLYGDDVQSVNSLLKGSRSFLPPPDSLFGEKNGWTGHILGLYYIKYTVQQERMAPELLKLLDHQVHPIIANVMNDPGPFWRLVDGGHIKQLARELSQVGDDFKRAVLKGRDIFIIGDRLYVPSGVTVALLKDCREVRPVHSKALNDIVERTEWVRFEQDF